MKSDPTIRKRLPKLDRSQKDLFRRQSNPPVVRPALLWNDRSRSLGVIFDNRRPLHVVSSLSFPIVAVQRPLELIKCFFFLFF